MLYGVQHSNHTCMIRELHRIYRIHIKAKKLQGKYR
jgi:hypothetical protein